MIPVPDVLLRGVGAFYIFAGVVSARAILSTSFLDRALAAIEMKKPDFPDRLRTWWLATGSVLVLSSGICLIFLLDTAVWIFAASSFWQAAYLFVLAPFFLDTNEDAQSEGRRQTANAFYMHCAVTALVMVVWRGGMLSPLDAVNGASQIFIGVVVAGHTAYVLSNLLWSPK